MKEMIKSYLEGACTVKKRIDELGMMIKKEADTEKRKELMARRELLKTERYEMLSDVSDMIRLCTKKNLSGDE